MYEIRVDDGVSVNSHELDNAQTLDDALIAASQTIRNRHLLHARPSCLLVRDGSPVLVIRQDGTIQLAVS